MVSVHRFPCCCQTDNYYHSLLSLLSAETEALICPRRVAAGLIRAGSAMGSPSKNVIAGGNCGARINRLSRLRLIMGLVLVLAAGAYSPQ
jgi:hypothetical protein